MAHLRVVRPRRAGVGGSGCSNSPVSATRCRYGRAAKAPVPRRRASPNDAAGKKSIAIRVLIR